MCGIVGLLILDRDLERELGRLLTAMLVQMTERGPD
jgi:glutamate synthase domain-containing protein 1